MENLLIKKWPEANEYGVYSSYKAEKFDYEKVANELCVRLAVLQISDNEWLSGYWYTFNTGKKFTNNLKLKKENGIFSTKESALFFSVDSVISEFNHTLTLVREDFHPQIKELLYWLEFLKSESTEIKQRPEASKKVENKTDVLNEDDLDCIWKLNETEKKELKECETTIQSGLVVFYEVGEALQYIFINKLYREHYSSFEAYCKDKWDITSKYAKNLIASSEVIEEVKEEAKQTGTIVPLLPQTESQARELKNVPEGKKLEVLNQVAEAVGSGEKLTANLIQEKAAPYIAPKKESKKDPEVKPELQKTYLDIGTAVFIHDRKCIHCTNKLNAVITKVHESLEKYTLTCISCEKVAGNFKREDFQLVNKYIADVLHQITLDEAISKTESNDPQTTTSPEIIETPEPEKKQVSDNIFSELNAHKEIYDALNFIKGTKMFINVTEKEIFGTFTEKFILKPCYPNHNMYELIDKFINNVKREAVDEAALILPLIPEAFYYLNEIPLSMCIYKQRTVAFINHDKKFGQSLNAVVLYYGSNESVFRESFEKLGTLWDNHASLGYSS